MIYLLSPLIAYALLVFFGFLYALWHVPFATRKAFGDYKLGIKLSCKWFALALIGVCVEYFALWSAWFFILFANHNTGRMPRGLQWLETHDAVLPGYPPEQGFNLPYPQTWWAYYWQSVCWLYRNRVYRFTAEVCGVSITPNVERYHYGDSNTSDEPPVKLGQFVEVTRNCFEIHKVFQMFGRNWEWRIGYKLAWTVGKEANAQHVLRLRSGSKITKV